MIGLLALRRKIIVAAKTIPGHSDMVKVHLQPIRRSRVADVTGARGQGVAQRLAGRINPVMTGWAARKNIPVIEVDVRPGPDRMAGLTIAGRRQMASHLARRGRPVVATHTIRGGIRVHEVNIRPGNTGSVAAVTRVGGRHMTGRLARGIDPVVAACTGSRNAGMVELYVEP